jgi:branched-chain amino acid transport system ATP-binding protein
MLTVEALTVGYRETAVLHEVTLQVDAGQRICVLGSNGAGKTTLLRAISGQLDWREGQIFLDGESLAGYRPDQIVRAGVVHVPEGRGVFTGMSVRDNLLVGAHSRKPRESRESLDRVLNDFPMLQTKLQARGGTLSGGQQQMLAIGRGMMANPKVLLLDEPTVGLAPIVVQELISAVSSAGSDRQMAIILVEQNVVAALSCTSFAYVLSGGRIVTAVPANELSEQELVDNYLGASVSTAVEKSIVDGSDIPGDPRFEV